jgi:transposase
MQNLSVQLSLPNIYSSINKSFVSNKSNLISLLEEHINFDSFISLSFHQTFYSHMGRDHIYHLNSFICALVFQKILGIGFDTLLINILKLSPELCDFYRFRKVPDSSQFSRFRKKLCSFYL